MNLTRRSALATGAALTISAALPAPAAAQASAPATRRIPSSGESIPAIGLGTWITFNVGADPVLQQECTAVMAALFAAGGRVIDSSPMYGSAQAVIGRGLGELGAPAGLFAADKVWTSSDGPQQIAESQDLWGVPRFDLLQVHNLLAWEEHLPILREMKQAGRLRFVGITTSEGRRHDLFEEVMRGQPLDFIQVTYNIVDREVEARILPLARDRGMAVMINRPFQQGALTRRLAREAPSRLGGRDRRHELGADHPEIHPVASRRHGGDSSDLARRSCAGECRRLERPAARCGDAPAHGRVRGGALNERLDHVRPVRLPAVLAARLLAHVRAAQRGALAAARWRCSPPA